MKLLRRFGTDFEHLLHTKRSQTQEIYTQMQNYKYSHFVHASTSPSISRYEIGSVSEPLRTYAILRKSGQTTTINAHHRSQKFFLGSLYLGSLVTAPVLWCNRRKIPIYEKGYRRERSETQNYFFIFIFNYFVKGGLFISININSVAKVQKRSLEFTTNSASLLEVTTLGLM